MKLKPGKYVQRDGGIATVAAVDETRSPGAYAVGWKASGVGGSWFSNGSFMGHSEHLLDLIREYREPREFWLLRGIAFANLKAAEFYATSQGIDNPSVIHAREVLLND